MQLIGDQFVDASDIRDAIDKWLEAPPGMADRTPVGDPPPTLDTWGLSTEAQRGQEAMMRLLG